MLHTIQDSFSLSFPISKPQSYGDIKYSYLVRSDDQQAY